MKSLICTLLSWAVLLMPASLALAGIDRATALRELDWPKKWESVIDRQSSKYLNRVAKSDLASLPAPRREFVVGKLQRQIHQELSWSRLGNRFTQVMTESCSDGVLSGMVQVKHRRIRDERAQDILRAYKKCAASGYKRAMPLLQQSFRRLLPALRKTISDHPQ